MLLRFRPLPESSLDLSQVHQGEGRVRGVTNPVGDLQSSLGGVPRLFQLTSQSLGLPQVGERNLQPIQGPYPLQNLDSLMQHRQRLLASTQEGEGRGPALNCAAANPLVPNSLCNLGGTFCRHQLIFVAP